jgi:hypothetical protein
MQTNCIGRFFNVESFKDKVDLTESVMDIDELLISKLYDLPLLRGAIKETLLKQMESNHYGLDKSNLMRFLPSFLKNELLVDSLILELINEGDLIFLSDKIYRRKYPTALEYAESLSKPQDCAVLTGRLYGQTLNEVGKKLNITRERVRQIESKCIHKAPALSEDLYALFFKI